MDRIAIVLAIVGIVTAWYFWQCSEWNKEIADSYRDLYLGVLEDYNKLYSKYISLYYNHTNITKKYQTAVANLNESRKEIKRLKETIKELESNYTELKEKYQEFVRIVATSDKIRKYASKKEIKEFLLVDDTDEIEYNYTTWNCVDYTNLLIRKLLRKGIFACGATVVFEEGAHEIVAFKTEDGKLYYIEGQSDEIIPGDKLKVGENYCKLLGIDCNWTIKKISSCFYISTYDE